jgi:guanosine-3',5'-bis(diphosphate) 3'-pyrophosphohydrolase
MRLVRATHFAAVKHQRQVRKDAAKTPYINHPIAVAHILTEAGVQDEDVLIGALLHDTVEGQLTFLFIFFFLHLIGEASTEKGLQKAS